MNYGDREKSTLPASPIEPYIADWKERRKYALLQAAAVIFARTLGTAAGGREHIAAASVAAAEELLERIESRLPESAE